MKRNRTTIGLASIVVLLIMAFGCGDSDNDRTSFRVRVENATALFSYFLSGAFDTPAGASAPAPIAAGQAYSFRVAAAPGFSLSFATMYVQSNDLFFAPTGSGIPLFDDQGMPISGDITASVYLWDAGTELNEEPGTGPNQAPRQSGPDTGPPDSDSTVRMVNDGFTYPAVADVISVSVQHEGGNEFTVTIENVSAVTPLAPGVYVVHDTPDPLFTEGTPDTGGGLEALAEDGAPTALADGLASMSGLTSPFAPGVWAVHQTGMPLFASGQPEPGLGLEALAEDGDASVLAAALNAAPEVSTSGSFSTPEGSDSPGPIGPDAAYSFLVHASANDRLSFATMLVQSNDLFIAPDPAGIPLFDATGAPLEGDITSMVYLWDAGTEENQWPGAGPDQPPRQTGPDTGAADQDATVRFVNDRFSYPDPAKLVRILVTPE